MYEVVYKDELWWITKDGRVLKDLGGFTDPLSPEIIIKEIENEV